MPEAVQTGSCHVIRDNYVVLTNDKTEPDDLTIIIVISTYLYNKMSVCLFVCLAVCPFVSLSVLLFTLCTLQIPI